MGAMEEASVMLDQLMVEANSLVAHFNNSLAQTQEEQEELPITVVAVEEFPSHANMEEDEAEEERVEVPLFRSGQK